MNSSNDNDSFDLDDLDRTEARPPRRRESGGDDAEAQVPETIRKDHDSEPDDDRTIARSGASPSADSVAPEGESTLRRDALDPADDEPEQTLQRGGGGSGATVPGEAFDATLRQADAVTDPRDPMIGRVLGGCRIESRLGEGGMGTVYRARQLDIDREVAIKTIRPEFAADAESMERFQREARAVGKFRTQNVVQIYGVGNEGGVPFIVLELLPGGSLREYVARQEGGRITADDAVRFMRDSAHALADAAAKNVVHRDIKPDNLLLDEHGIVKVTDFGISKVVHQDASMTLTMGGVVGTPMYMSPEQCRGDELDFRSDMWSLGATFFFLLTGKPPAKGSSLLELIRTKNEVKNLDPAKILPAEVPGPLSEVVRRLTMLDPADRYDNYDDLLADLDAIAGGHAVGGGGGVARALRWVAAVGIIGGLGFAGYQNRAALESFIDATFAGGEDEPNVPEEQDDGGGPAVVVVDLTDYEQQIEDIAKAVNDAPDRVALDLLTDRANQVERNLDEVPAGNDTSSLRADLAGVLADIGARAGVLEFAAVRRGRQDQLADLREKVGGGADLSEALVDLQTFIDAIPPSASWDDMREEARSLRQTGRLGWFETRLEEIEQRFGDDGPSAAARVAATLVAELAKESSTGGFEELRARADQLDQDARTGVSLEDRLPPVPDASIPFGDIAAWSTQVRKVTDAAAETARTALLGQWVKELVQTRLQNEDLRTAVRQELERAWTECKAARQQNDVRRAAELNREITAAIDNLAGLPGFDPQAVIPPSERTDLVAWIAGASEVEALVADVQKAIEAQQQVATLNGWLAKKASADKVRAVLTERLADVEGDDRLAAVLAELDRGMGFWTAVTERVDRALRELGDARLSSAEQTLRMTDLVDTPVDPGSIAEVQVLRTAVAALARGFEVVVTDLAPAQAAREFQRAGSELARLPEALQGVGPAQDYASDCAKRAQELESLVRGMAPVTGGRVEIGVGQAGIDGSFDVGGFFLDRHEVSRRVFSAALQAGAIREVDDRELQRLRAERWSSQPEFPVVGISRAAAVDCLRSMGKTLPTHREWWLATKGAGDQSGFPRGKSLDDLDVKTRSSSLEVSRDRRPFDVGGVEVHFLVGNAAEWVADPLDGTRGAVVGGGFGYSLRSLRDAALGNVRVVRMTGQQEESVGFRGVVRPKDHFGALFPAPR